MNGERRDEHSTACSCESCEMWREFDAVGGGRRMVGYKDVLNASNAIFENFKRLKRDW